MEKEEKTYAAVELDGTTRIPLELQAHVACD